MMQRGGVDSDDEGEISDDDDIPTVDAVWIDEEDEELSEEEEEDGAA